MVGESKGGLQTYFTQYGLYCSVYQDPIRAGTFQGERNDYVSNRV